jgi:hypothetical protein
MGIGVTDLGISIQLCHPDGSPDGPPVHGRYAAVFGKDRNEILQYSGVAETQDEHDFKGSDDWITLVAVADSKEKLEELVHETGIPRTPANTSGSSHRARIEVNVAGVRRSFRNRIAIASGPILKLGPPPKSHVFHVKVLPERTQLGALAQENPNNPNVIEFVGNTILLQ